MREIEHSELFTPPAGTRVIVVPTVGETWPRGQTYATPMDSGYAQIARRKWPLIDINLGILQWQLGARATCLTREHNGHPMIPGKRTTALPPKYHIVTLPVRRFKDGPLSLDWICAKARELVRLCDEDLPWLNTGDVVLPQLTDLHEFDWPRIRRHVEAYLPDRYVVISGNPTFAI